MTDRQPSGSLSGTLIRNTLLNLVGRSWLMLVAFFLTPYIISKVGMQQFGVWSLVFVITSYFSLLDLGLTTSFAKYVAEYRARGDYAAINRIVNSGLALYLALAFAAIAVSFVFSGTLVGLFRIPADIFADARFVLMVAVSIYALGNVFGIFEAILVGLQRMDITNLIVLAISVPRVVGTILFLGLGFGLRGLIVNEALLFAGMSACLVVSTFHVLPQLRLSPRLFHSRSLRALLAFGLKVQVSQLADLASSQTDRLLVGYFLGLTPVAFYELGSRVVLTTKRTARILVSAIVPVASEIDAAGDRTLLDRLYRRGSKYLVLAAAPTLLFTIFAAPVIMAAWMGRGYDLSVIVVQVLAVGHLVHLLTGVGTTIAKGMGKPEYETKYSLVLLVLNTGLDIALIVVLGFRGVLIASSVSLIVSSLYFMALFHRLVDIPLLPFLREIYLQPFLACLLAGAPLLVFNTLAGPAFSGHGRVWNLMLLAAEGCLFFALVYGGLLVASKYLDVYDRNLLVRLGRPIIGDRIKWISPS